MTCSANPNRVIRKRHARLDNSSILNSFTFAAALPPYVLFVLLGFLQASPLPAATLEPEDSILEYTGHAEMKAEMASEPDNEHASQPDFERNNDRPDSDQTPNAKGNDASAATSDNGVNPSKASLGNLFQEAVLPDQKDLDSTASADIYRQTYNKLGTVVDEEALSEAALQLMDFNARLNDLNESIDERLEPAMQRLLGDPGREIILTDNKPARLDIESQSLELEAGGESPAQASVEMPTGIMGFLFQLPRYLFNVKNLLILLVCMLALSLILKAVHFILNRIY